MAQSIGDQLKEARNKRGLTLEQVSQATHIRRHYLEALENDQRDFLPSVVQGRGFLRLYAGHLDLPIGELLAAWDGTLPAEADAPSIAIPQDNPIEQEGSFTDPAPAEAPLPAINLADIAKPTVSATAAGRGDYSSENEESSHEIFLEIGQMLQKQRESLGLSRAEVERFTRLRQHYIQALEAGQIEQLPSPVQGRGMLSNYVKFLNMDEGKVLLRFAEGLQTRRIERIPKPEPGTIQAKKRPARQAPFWRRLLTPDLLFGVAVAGVILFSALWTTARISNVRNTQSEPTPPGVGGILLTPKADRTGTLAAALTPPGATSNSDMDVTPSTPPTVTPVNDPNQEVTQVEPTKTQAAGGQANTQNNLFTLTPAPAPIVTLTLAPINNDPLQIYIVARERAWLRVVADDKVKFLGRTVPGNAYAFSGTKNIELTTGDGAAMQVFFNQDDLGTLGTTGEVVSLIFSRDGLLTPTAAFTFTPTATPLATLTPLPTATSQATPTITPFIPNE